MVSFVTLLLRVCHTVTGSLLFAYTLAPFVYETAVQIPTPLLHSMFLVNIVSGLVNSVLLQPGKMGPKAGFWRFLVYSVKLGCLLVCTPLLNRLLADVYVINCTRLGSVLLAFAVGAYCRFYREEHSQKTK